MKWNYKSCYLILSLLAGIILVIAFNEIAIIIKGFIYAQVLIYASIHDLKTRIIPDKVHGLILMIGLIKIDILASILGLLLVPIPFLIPALFKENSIGGGDIKLMAASGFLLGLRGGIMASIIGLLIAIIVQGNFKVMSKAKSNHSFAMAPYLSMGCFLSYLIQ